MWNVINNDIDSVRTIQSFHDLIAIAMPLKLIIIVY